MITKEQIRNILGAEISAWRYPTSYDLDRAAQMIAKLIQDDKAKASPPAHYPDPGCDCGGERARAAHASWCGLTTGRVTRRI